MHLNNSKNSFFKSESNFCIQFKKGIECEQGSARAACLNIYINCWCKRCAAKCEYMCAILASKTCVWVCKCIFMRMSRESDESVSGPRQPAGLIMHNPRPLTTLCLIYLCALGPVVNFARRYKHLLLFSHCQMRTSQIFSLNIVLGF